MWASFVHSSSLGPTLSHLSVVIRAAPLIMSAGWHSTFPSTLFSFQFHLWYWIELLGCCWLQARRQMNTQLLEPLSSKREFLLSLHFVFVQINRLICIPFPAQFQFGKNAWQLPAKLANLRQMITHYLWARPGDIWDWQRCRPRGLTQATHGLTMSQCA